MRSRWKGPVCFFSGLGVVATSNVLFKSVLRRKFIEVYNGRRSFYLRLRPAMLGNFVAEHVSCKRSGRIHRKVDRRKKIFNKGRAASKSRSVPK